MNLWSSSPSSGSAWNHNLNSTYATVNRNTNSKANGFSVRCLKHWLIAPGSIYMIVFGAI
ncbi:MAG: hypothetical protein WC427_00735 [Candidatus Paceibacterota bacterium]